MRIMYDGITPSTLPPDGDIYASYINGHWPNYFQLSTLFPGKLYVSITVDPTVPADVYDCEPGNGTPADVPGWVTLARAAGYTPTVYCNYSTWGAVQAACFSITPPMYWIASYDGDPTLYPGTVAKQYASYPGYDISSVVDYWPGIDKPLTKDDDTMQQLIQYVGPSSRNHDAIYLSDNMTQRWITDQTALANVRNQLRQRGWSDTVIKSTANPTDYGVVIGPTPPNAN